MTSVEVRDGGRKMSVKSLCLPGPVVRLSHRKKGEGTTLIQRSWNPKIGVREVATRSWVAVCYRV